MDESIFPSNEDIAEFSETALKITIPRWQKKAKFELVGHIVCHAVKLDDLQVANLVRALTLIVDGENAARQILTSRKEQGLSWNEVIQNLLARAMSKIKDSVSEIDAFISGLRFKSPLGSPENNQKFTNCYRYIHARLLWEHLLSCT